MGEVYAGLDETLKRRVALKVIRPDYRLDAHTKARFLREAQILSTLDHPNICRVYSYVETEDGAWLVLELIEGRNLRAAIDAGLGAAQRLSIATQIAGVLVATHAAGIVHRDLKPGNVMVTAAGEVKVLDFGLARSLPAGAAPADEEDVAPPSQAAVAQDAEATRLPGRERPTAADPEALETERGALLGTLAYMSPEQARAEPATIASDLYSFGLLLQELFTGRRPFDAREDSAALLERARRGGVPAPVGIDADLARLIERLKSVAPSDRPTAVDTLERLRWIGAKPARRVRRLVVVAAVLIAVLGVAKYFLDLRAERSAAVAARIEADHRRGQAEDLIAFMLGDLRKKLEKVGRLEILDEVGTKAMDYFAAVPESTLTDNELGDRAAALYQIGDVRIAQGRMGEAVKPLTQSLALARTLAARHPDQAPRLYALAQSEFWVGYVEWRQRHLDAALVHFREYLRLAQRMVSLAPGNADYRLELASANSNIGSVLEEKGHLEEALERFGTTLAIETALLRERPDDATLRGSVASSNNAIGAVLRALGRLDESLAHHRTELSMQEDLVRREAGNVQWRQYLGVSHARVAMLLEAKGDMSEAAAHARSALDVIQALAAQDASNVDWQRELGRTHYRVGVIADASDDIAAGAHLQQAAAILGRAAALDPLNVGRQRDVADARAALARHFLAAGLPARADAEASAAQQIAERLLERDAGDRQAARLRGLALVLRAGAAAQRGQQAEAREHFAGAHAALEPLAAGSRDYAVLDPWALALAGTGRRQDARRVLADLDTMRFRNPSLSRALASGRAAAAAHDPVNPR